MRVIGRTVGSYQVKQRLGQGGVGSVYRVEHTVLGSMHALKVLTMPSERSKKRLLAEGQIQARLDHPNLVAVRDVVDVDGHPGLILDLVRGPTLGRLLAAGPLPVEAIAAIGAGILRGMAKAHAAGLVHRDIKPGNVLLHLGDDELMAKVADFGLAREAEGAGVTATGASLGTPRYMAPEQVRDPRDVDARSDVWALGALLYELCCGRPAFERDDDLLELYGDIAAARYPSLDSRRQGLPEPWVAAVDAALQVDRDARPADAAALLELWSQGPAAAVPEAVLATVRTLVPPLLDDVAPQHTWSGGDTFDSMAAPVPRPVGLATPPEPDAPEPFHEPPAPLPSVSRPGERRRVGATSVAVPALVGGGVVLLVVLGGMLLVFLGYRTDASVPPPVVGAPPAIPAVPMPAPPVPRVDATAERSSRTGVQKATQAFLDGDPVGADEQVHYFVAAAPTEDPQLLTIAVAAANARRSSAWEELERGRHNPFDPFEERSPLQALLAATLGEPDTLDEALLETGHEAAIYARLRMGPRHAERDAALLDALSEAAGPRRIVDLARAQVAMGTGDLAGARTHLDAALQGDDVPEWVHLTDALWQLRSGDAERAAAIVDPWIDGVERPSRFAWMLRWEIAERLGRSVQADEAAKRFRGPATVQAMRRWLRADGLFEDGDVPGGLAEALEAEEDLHRYAKSREVNAVRLDVLMELARLGALAGDRAVVKEVLARLSAVPGDTLPPARTGTLPVRIDLVEALLVGLDGRRDATDALRGELVGAPVRYAEEIRVLDDVARGAPIRVHPSRFF